MNKIRFKKMDGTAVALKKSDINSSLSGDIIMPDSENMMMPAPYEMA
jgi:hypothetical protein